MGQLQTSRERVELQRLRKENKRLSQEREILKTVVPLITAECVSERN